MPESNFVSEEKSLLPQPVQIYIPFPLFLQYFPVYAGSVPFPLKIWYCSRVSFFFHSSSDLCINFILKGRRGRPACAGHARAHIELPPSGVCNVLHYQSRLFYH